MAEKPMSGLQKIALLLKSLPKETVDKVLKHMDPRQGNMLVSEISKLANDPKLAEKLPTILDEAAQILQNAPSAKKDRPSPVQTASQAASPVKAPAAPVKTPGSTVDTIVDLKIDDNMAARAPVAPPPEVPTSTANPLLALAEVPAELLAAAMESENGRTVFILMEKMSPDQAAQIYKNLSPAKRKEISLRFSEKTAVNEHIVKQIAQGVLKKCNALRKSSAANNPDEERQKLMATMIKGLERAERMEMLENLGKTDPTLTERVKNLLYDFEVIARMENSTVQKLLADVNMQALATALRGAPDGVEERLMTNLSKRAQETLREEISLLSNVTPAAVQEARVGIVQIIQMLDQRGEFLLRE